MNYEIVRGDPWSRDGCIIVERDGSDPLGWYTGHLDARRREWTLYPYKRAERHYAPLQKKTLPESAVKPKSRRDTMRKKQKKSKTTTKEDQPPQDMQVRLV